MSLEKDGIVAQALKGLRIRRSAGNSACDKPMYRISALLVDQAQGNLITDGPSNRV